MPVGTHSHESIWPTDLYWEEHFCATSQNLADALIICENPIVDNGGEECGQGQPFLTLWLAGQADESQFKHESET